MEKFIAEIPEIIAVIANLIYPYLSGKNKRSSWFFAVLGAIIYTIINFQTHLYFFSILNVFYIIVGIYGWFAWNNSTTAPDFHFLGKQNVPIVIAGFGLTFGLAYLAKEFTNQFMPFWDAANFVFALLASYFITQRIMEAWIYLLVVNIISVYLYLNSALYPSAILYLFLALLAINAFRDWMKLYTKKSPEND